MNIIQAIIIGVVQGLTEFLPVSSSAHLVFAQNILGVESSLAFDVFLHLGTLVAVLWFFRYDIIKMLKSWWLSIGDILQRRFMEGFRDDPYKRLAWYVILATIPVGIVGVLFEDSVDALFAGALYVPAFFLFVTGYFLYHIVFGAGKSGIRERLVHILELSICPPLGWIGKRALIIYMLHQPIIYLVLNIIEI